MAVRVVFSFIIVLALLPSTVGRGQGIERPAPRTTPAEVAAAMLPCLARQGVTPTMEATVDAAWIDEGLGAMVSLRRYDAEQTPGSSNIRIWLRDDPIRPPLVVEFEEGDRRVYSQPRRGELLDCFGEVYPPRRE